jgi:hypothetical protein
LKNKRKFKKIIDFLTDFLDAKRHAKLRAKIMFCAVLNWEKDQIFRISAIRMDLRKKHGLCPISSIRKVLDKFKILRNASEADMPKRETWGVL